MSVEVKNVLLLFWTKRCGQHRIIKEYYAPIYFNFPYLPHNQEQLTTPSRT